jgi:ketosteroid isomerase-like protein
MRRDTVAEMPNVVVTRVPYSGPRQSRNLYERLMVRFPGAYRALVALGLRLFSPRSRLRRAMLSREIVSGWGAAWRRDYELMLVRYARDVEFQYDTDFEALGLGGTFHGHDGIVRFLESWGEPWEGWELRPAAVLDMGDRFLALAHVRLPGTTSGVKLESEFAQLVTVRDGLVTRDQEFRAWDKGLRAAGLDPDALPLPSSGQTQAANRAA